MTEPSLALQIAIVAALSAASIGVPIFDQIPAAAPLPYVQTGDDQVVPDAFDCLDRSVTVHSTLHVFTARVGGGRRQAKALGGALVDALDHVALDLGADWTLVEIAYAGTRILDDPDGTTHAVVTFISLLDPA